VGALAAQHLHHQYRTKLTVARLSPVLTGERPSINKALTSCAAGFSKVAAPIRFTRWRNLMVTSSRYLVTLSPARCAFCNEFLPSRDSCVEFWRTSDGRHFCSEFCADDAEEAQFRERHAIAHSTTTDNQQVPARPST
jgi:hypothetical protein